jgi:hypothetical protein
LFDCALHFRFLQKASEAMFEMGQASVAATLACQSRIYNEMTDNDRQPAAASPGWPNWLGDWQLAVTAARPPAVDPMQSWLAMSSAYSLWPAWLAGQQPAVTAPAWSNPVSAWTAAFGAWQDFAMSGRAEQFTSGIPAGVSGWPAATMAFWGVSPWTLYQGPMIATMLSYGVPYAVAAPTARASTSAMDAADAACAQWHCVFGDTNERTRTNRTGAGLQPWAPYTL